MIKTTITPQKNSLEVPIPDSYIGKPIEVLLYTADEINNTSGSKPATMGMFEGVISKQTAEHLQQQLEINRNEWNRNI